MLTGLPLKVWHKNIPLHQEKNRKIRQVQSCTGVVLRGFSKVTGHGSFSCFDKNRIALMSADVGCSQIFCLCFEKQKNNNIYVSFKHFPLEA